MGDCSVVAKPRNTLALRDKQIQELTPKWAALFKSLGPSFNADEKGMVFIPTLKKHTQAYCKNLDASLHLAVRSHSVLHEAQMLYEDIANLDGPVPPELQSKLADIRQRSQDIKQEISLVAASMHKGRQGFIAASYEIDAKQKALADKRQKHEQDSKAAKTNAIISAVLFIFQLLFELFITSNTFPLERGGFFILSLLPRFGWTAKDKWSEYEKSSREQAIEIKKCDEEARELQSVAEQLPDLETMSAWFVKHWDDLEEDYDYTAKNMGDLSHDATFKLRMKRIADDMGQHKLSFRAYKHALSPVRDRYAPLLLCGSKAE